MFKYLFLLSFIYILSSCSSNSAAIDTKAYEEQKQGLADREKARPLAFLHIKSSHRKNWVGQTVVSGTITNTATVSSYKDLRLRMLCYDKNLKMVEEHEDVLDRIIKPNMQIEYKLRYKLPRNTDSIAVSIMSVNMVDE